MTCQEFIRHVESNQEAVRRFLTALCCGNSGLADDLAQEAFMKAYLSLDDFRGESGFRTWVFRIAYTTFVSDRRAARCRFEPIESATSVASPGRADSGFDNQALYAALEQLSEKERSAILLHYMQGYSVAEIADITESTVAAVKQLLSRGRVHLKDLLS